MLNREFGRKRLIPFEAIKWSDTKCLGVSIQNKKHSQKIEWMSTLCKKVFNEPKGDMRDVFTKVRWVYGLRSRDV